MPFEECCDCARKFPWIEETRPEAYLGEEYSLELTAIFTRAYSIGARGERCLLRDGLLSIAFFA